jgi:hypothetical protein
VDAVVLVRAAPAAAAAAVQPDPTNNIAEKVFPKAIYSLSLNLK